MSETPWAQPRASMYQYYPLYGTTLCTTLLLTISTSIVQNAPPANTRQTPPQPPQDEERRNSASRSWSNGLGRDY
eukprot:8925355-Pyramimonas_sp.AAC.3